MLKICLDAVDTEAMVWASVGYITATLSEKHMFCARRA